MLKLSYNEKTLKTKNRYLPPQLASCPVNFKLANATYRWIRGHILSHMNLLMFSKKFGEKGYKKKHFQTNIKKNTLKLISINLSAECFDSYCSSKLSIYISLHLGKKL